MPDKRTHRGAHPEDAKLFSARYLNNLRSAVADYSLLLSKGYAQKSTLKLVGDRFSLTDRQRLAVMRCGCSDAQLATRRANEVKVAELGAEPIVVDGYNVLITTEAALAGAPIFRSRDGCYRDLAGIHGSYRKVTETIPAIEISAKCLQDLRIESALWLFDSPVSNSGRLKTIIASLAEENGWPWQIELLTNPDVKLIETDITAATGDSDVLDKCGKWTNLTAYIIATAIPDAKIIDLSIP
ncbi:MAG TPA: DUF434 domain-containing protein [Planctomycetes bacterium]|nr:DUF434 domain-containing protein [Planctomycetota bacterium]